MGKIFFHHQILANLGGFQDLELLLLRLLYTILGPIYQELGN